MSDQVQVVSFSELDVGEKIGLMLTAIHELSVDGVAPSSRIFQENRGDMCTTQWLVVNTGMKWEEILDSIGLQGSRSQGFSALSHDERLARVSSVLHDMAVDGVAPTKAGYNRHKPEGMLTPHAIERSLGLAWSEIVDECGLRSKYKQRKRLTDEQLDGIVSQMMAIAQGPVDGLLQLQTGKKKRGTMRYFDTARFAWVERPVYVGWFG